MHTPHNTHNTQHTLIYTLILYSNKEETTSTSHTTPFYYYIQKCNYTIINNKTVGTREWKFMYQIREDVLDISYFGDMEDEEVDMDQLEISVIERGMVVEECESKAEALDKVKQLITQTHKSYSIIPIKVPNIAPISAFGVYTPSKNAKKGIFIACGVNAEIDD